MIEPESCEEIAEIVKQARENKVVLRVFGGTFPSQVKKGELWVSIARLTELLSCDPEKEMVTVEAGITLRDLMEILRSINLTLKIGGWLPNMTLIDAISVGLIGANTSIGGLIEKCEVVLPGGDVQECGWAAKKEGDKEDNSFNACNQLSPTLQSVVCGLGLGGAITNVTLRCTPLHTILENNREHTLAEFLGNWDKFTQIYYVHARWFALIDTFLVTSAFSMRLHLSYAQPVTDQVMEVLWCGLTAFVSTTRTWFSWVFPSCAWVMARAHYYCLRNKVAQRTNYCFPAQQFVSLRRHCRGVKWILPAENRVSVLENLNTWVHQYPQLCSSPAVICIQRNQCLQNNAFLSPYSCQDTFSIWVDWFHNTSSYFSPELAEFEALLQENGGRKCWSVGPVSISPLIGDMYPGFREWRATRLLLDQAGILQSAYVEGEFIIKRN